MPPAREQEDHKAAPFRLSPLSRRRASGAEICQALTIVKRGGFYKNFNIWGTAMGAVESDRHSLADTIVRDIYEAALDVNRWEGVLEHICRYLDADSALLRFYDDDTNSVNFSFTTGFDPDFDLLYRQHFAQDDPIRAAAQHLPEGRTTLLDEVMPKAMLKGTDFYNEYMRPQDKYHVIGSRPYCDRGVSTLFGLQRGRRRPPFGREELERLTWIGSHVRQALRVHQRLGAAHRQTHSLETLIEHAGIAVVLLAASGRVVYANESAQALLRERSTLTLRNGALHALRRDLDARLQRLIAEATAVGQEISSTPGGSLRLVAEGTDRVLVVTPWRAPSDREWLLQPNCVAAVLIGAAKRPETLCAELVMEAWGLTRCEARMAIALARHGDIESVCEELGITRNTARSYLKSIFRKTGCQRQSELLRRLLASPIPVASAVLSLWESLP